MIKELIERIKSKPISKFERYDLNHKVDAFIKDYDKALRKAQVVTDIGEFHLPKDLRNYIESKAVYAEMTWPYVYYSHWLERDNLRNEPKQLLEFNEIEGPINERFPRLNFTNKDINTQVLYRIMERGGDRIGPRRGVLFAQDAGLDINIPVSYSIDYSDPYLYDFLEPLVSRLDLDTICPEFYFARSSDEMKEVEETRLKEIMYVLVDRRIKERKEININKDILSNILS